MWRSAADTQLKLLDRSLSPSLQNLAVPHDFYSLVSFSVERSRDPVFDGVRLAGFKSRANAFLLA